MESRTVVVIAVILLVLFAGWYYLSSVQRTPPNTGTAIVPVSQSGNQISLVGTTTPAQNEFTVTAYDFGFAPRTLTAKKGTHVKINVINQGGLHDFVIDIFHAHSPRLGSGASTTVEFDATKVGSFPYYSSVGNDSANGMSGMFSVTP